MFLKLFQRAWFGGDFASIIGECACPRGSVFNNRELRCDSELSIWNFKDLKKIIADINDTEFMCKKNPQISNSIFFNFLTEICKKANSFS